MKNIENDLINGSVIKKHIVFSIPLFIANLLQSFYSIIDMVIVGRFFAEFFAPFPSAAVGLIYFYIGRWKKIKLIK